MDMDEQWEKAKSDFRSESTLPNDVIDDIISNTEGIGKLYAQLPSDKEKK